ncbi:MAG: structural maintenance of chromosomes 2 [Trebouxia sp. A1-2]|nr:MAG: structural maintenance of chromosomes 2 [Trebouxia sp. A1-2]
MYIEEVTIDGFKSYAQRVTVPNFDRYFNAITGLNGSGKSNILDSICFVLGITNLQQVRASSLQELVYKQGQAGITKATVSIVFNNEDKQTSPVGFDHDDKITVTRQLVIGGRNKYLINGHNAQPSRVQNLFHSVQLNVNNPHFLIMQGRITKVLNMKPPEILGMLEEAAGTRMYESKKEAALRTLDKKQVKVEEINKVLHEDILPALEKLRKEKGQYMEWQAADAKLGHLKRFCAAFRYQEAQRLRDDGQGEIETVKAKLEEGNEAHASLEEEMKSRDADIRTLQASCTDLPFSCYQLPATEKEVQSGGEVKELADAADKLSKRLIEASIEELAQEGMEARLAAAQADSDQAQAACQQAAVAVEAAERELAGAQAGDGRDESNRSLQERLADAHNAQTSAEADAKQADMRSKHLQKQLTEQQKGFQSLEKEAVKLQRDLAKEEAAVQGCRSRLDDVVYDAEAAQQLEAVVVEEKAHVQRCKEMVDDLASHLAGVNFQYRDPERGFNRGKVKGVVAKLVHLQDPATTTALEVAAGGKLYQVVVDSDMTAKALLSNGQLRNRVTIIPLNKVKPHVAAASVTAAAQRVSNGSAQLALELVGYDQDLTAAMQYVFGNAFVCKDSCTAKALAFHKEVRTRCITLEGDDFNPGGLLTGGSRNSTASILTRLHALAEAEQQLAGHSTALQQAQAALQSMAAAAASHNRLKQELEVKQHSLSLLQQRISSSESAQLADAMAATQQELEQAQQAAHAAQQKKADMVKAAKELAADIANFGSQKEQRTKAAQAKQKAAKASLEASKKTAKDAAQKLTQAKAESEAAATECQSLTEQLQAAQKALHVLEAEVAKLGQAVAAAKLEYDAAAARLEELRHRLKECDREISTLAADKAALAQQVTDLAVDKKKLQHKLGKMQKDIAEAEDHCKRLQKEFPWIATEKDFFGKPGSDYDFEAQDVQAAFEEYEAANQSLQRLANKVNRKVLTMFEKADAEYAELSQKKQILHMDKDKIEKVIGELDEKKREALHASWVKVNQDFGSIFTSLLPGTMAKLEPPEGQTFLAGLEVKVGFGDVWKQSLSELSGGQRSLLALSLILAMLLFKPAPIYILDEVDAALDLSHTQNIGRMIKTHFPYSQFIVVSLKEGMFNNANVIYRTKFVDGVSAVTRTVPDKRSEQQASAGSKTAAHQPNRPALTENRRH